MGGRVLIIEDNKDAADSLRALLEMCGHEVRVAYTGPDGVHEADSWRPEYVLCDIGLPGMDGYGVAAELRRRSVIPRALLIAITGYGSDEDRMRAYNAGFRHHFTKPADPFELIRMLAGAG
jgi:CheY-like chemotaxis protein